LIFLYIKYGWLFICHLSILDWYMLNSFNSLISIIITLCDCFVILLWNYNWCNDVVIVEWSWLEINIKVIYVIVDNLGCSRKHSWIFDRNFGEDFI